MTSQQFFLRWDNYSNYISYAFGTLRNQEDLVDVTLSCEGKKIRAHKVLLSACSTYFRDVFKDNPCQHPVIVFKNVRFDDLLAIVEFMYQGEVSVLQESLTSFLNTAELLSVQGLTEGGNNNQSSSQVTSGTIIDTLTMPKTVTLKASPQQPQQAMQQQTVTLIPTQTMQPERRMAKKIYPGQTTATTIKTVTHPITVFSPKGAVQGTKRFVTTAPVKLTTANQQHQQQATTTTLVATTMNTDQLMDTGTLHLQGSVSHQPQILNTGSTTVSAGGSQQQVKRKRILFDSDENISIEDVNYVKQMSDMDGIPDYIEIQTSSTDDDKGGMVTVSAEDLISATEEGDSQTQEIIEEAYDASQVEDDDDDKDKEMEITYTKDEQGNGTVVLTPINSTSKDNSDKQQSVNIVQGDGTNTKWSQCSFCKLVITSVNLWRHIRTQHTEQQTQVCQYCNKNFKNKYSLREHIRIAHEKLTAAQAGGGGGGGGTNAGSKGNSAGSGNEDSEANTDSDLLVLKSEK